MDLINVDSLIDSAMTIGGQLLLLIIVYLIVAPLGKKAVTSGVEQTAKRQKLSEGRTKTLQNLLVNVFTYVLLFFFIVTFLGILGIPLGPILAGAGIVGLAVGFGAQGLVSDIVTGFFILIEKQIDVDDYVTAGGHDGIVEELGLRTTKLRGFDGTLHYIPNRNIQVVNNHTRGNMRALVDMNIGYSENIDEAIRVLQNVCDQFTGDGRLKEGPDVVGVQSFGSSEVVLRVIAQTEKMEQWGVERDLRKAMKEALDEAGIEIPFPHHVVLNKNEQ
ncbi:mechanosensitive ion channel family protein [Alkalibacillus haloalkaliphilus]|uniref:Putative MscS family protein YkuT n=1 Tax=Alkalibacillus haloalkaliphilus TaxID=94136 RepID=A0A511W2Y8_9BACI|nr:mechanosensitive ion channel family protein [Alkalibacillus haloalkaliphilus]GEN45317.1 putative MscS family protein YkuT [Alkalibacillus haloalkaliphilus]